MRLRLGLGIRCQSQSRMFSFDMVKILNPHLHKSCIKKEVLPEFLLWHIVSLGRERKRDHHVGLFNTELFAYITRQHPHYINFYWHNFGSNFVQPIGGAVCNSSR